jgi:hypothetical protein
MRDCEARSEIRFLFFTNKDNIGCRLISLLDTASNYLKRSIITVSVRQVRLCKLV